MLLNDLNRFEEFAESCGNRYLAIRWISKWARQLAAEYRDYAIAESKLLQWVITGHCPYIESELELHRRPTLDDELSEVLEWVSDKEVVSEVRNLYIKGIKNRRLITCSRKDFSKSKISRTNILLRMVWYGISEERS